MSPTAQPFDPRNFPLKKKLKKTMGVSLILRYIKTMYVKIIFTQGQKSLT